MMTLYHSPMSRSTNVVALIAELGAGDAIAVETVFVRRRDGSGGHDPRNPHPEGKVPFLVHDGMGIREQSAIFAHLTSLYPQAGLAPKTGTAAHGVFLSWLAYYQGVIEPVLAARFAGGGEDPAFHATFRGWDEMVAQLERPLADGDYLLGTQFTAADLLISAPFGWFPDMMPDSQLIRDWVARCAQRPAMIQTLKAEAKAAETS